MDDPLTQPVHSPTEGNLAVKVLVDSRLPGCTQVEATVLAALGHLGLPYQTRDLARGPLALGEIAPHPLIVLGHEGLGASLGEKGAAVLLEALASGVGLVSFDPRLQDYPPEFGTALRLSPQGEPQPSHILRTVTNDHWVSATRSLGEEIDTKQPVQVYPIRSGGTVLLASGDSRVVLSLGQHGRGRFAHWAVVPELWLPSHLGHGNGLDDLFWKSLVWCARKPVVMKAMPPFVTARVDDGAGVYSLWWIVQRLITSGQPFAPPLIDLICDKTPGGRSTAFNFAYLDALNEHGYIPNIGIYPDQIAEQDWPKLKAKRDAHLVELSAHAFSDFKDREGIDRIDFVYQASPSNPGRVGEPWSGQDSQATAQAKFERLDAIWQRRGIQPARTVNSHWHNPGPGALPFLKARGQTFMMLPLLFGVSHMDSEAKQWRIAPYGSGPCYADYLPVPPGVPGIENGDFFATGGYAGDFLGETVVGLSDRRTNDLEEAIRRLVRQLRLGMDSLFFGGLMAHEQRFAMLTRQELDTILSEADRLTGGYQKEFVGYDHISDYAKSRFDSHLATATLAPDGRVALRLVGKTTVPLRLYVFADDGAACSHRYETVAAFDGSTEVAF